MSLDYKQKYKMSLTSIPKYQEAIQQNLFQCACGRKEYIPRHKKRTICTWCGKWIYRDKKEEFKDRMRSALNG